MSFWDVGEERLVTEPWRERPREERDCVAWGLRSGTQGLQRPHAKPRVAAPSHNSLSNQARPALGILGTFRLCADALHFRTVPFVYPYIIDQQHCMWFPYETHCACSVG